MEEIKPTQPELKLINPRRTSPIPAEKPKRDPAPIRRKRNKAIRSIEITAAVSLAINVIQSIIIYILKPGIF